MPKNGSSVKYKLLDLTESLLNHIHGYFMFQKYTPEFMKPVGLKLTEGSDYIIYLAYTCHPRNTLKEQMSPNNNNINKRSLKDRVSFDG